MKIFITTLTVLMALMCMVAGAAKLMMIPEEVEFLSQFGFSEILMITFGIIQVCGGLLLAIPVTRLYGSLLVLITFGLSTILILISGNIVFAAVSCIPLLITGFLLFRSIKEKPALESAAKDS